MKTIEQIKALGVKSNAIDGRDVSRLATFIPEKDLEAFGLSLKEAFVGTHVAETMTRDEVLKALEDDVAFGFEKALDQRGISASCMFSVVQMWCWILEEGLEDWPDADYAQYGLPLFKAAAIKYGFPNPIGDDTGTEYKYSTYGDED